MRFRHLTLTCLFLLFATVSVANDVDPYLWLENVEGDSALAWVKERSAKDTAQIEAVPVFKPIREKLLEIFNSSDRIPDPEVRGAWIYNFWQDKDHVRGIWRRTTRAEYVKATPQWETVIDLDQLAASENENWVWKGAVGLEPDHTHFMVNLSRGGGDAVVVREFDGKKKTFVEGGFSLPEAKSDIGWRDENSLWVGTDFGEGSREGMTAAERHVSVCADDQEMCVPYLLRQELKQPERWFIRPLQVVEDQEHRTREGRIPQERCDAVK